MIHISASLFQIFDGSIGDMREAGDVDVFQKSAHTGDVLNRYIGQFWAAGDSDRFQISAIESEVFYSIVGESLKNSISV